MVMTIIILVVNYDEGNECFKNSAAVWHKCTDYTAIAL